MNAANLTPAQALTEVEAILERFTHFGVELGLERIKRLLAALGNPERRVPILHVAGSNGKGSVCAYLSAVLTAAGYRVGRYTSPHLVSWCERIWLNGQNIPAVELHALLLQVLAAIDPAQASPTQFEVITAVAWLYFAQQQVDIAVIEVGLGGRLDATNVCDRPLISIITSLSREHWQRLGPTLADISREKAGILKSNCPAVIAPQPPDATAVLMQRLTELNCPTVWVEPALDLGRGWAGFQPPDASFTQLQPLQYPLPLLGVHQRINSALAVAALQILRQELGWQISNSQIVAGMAETKWAGRLQWFDWQGQKLLIDGAHNPAGAEMLRDYVDRCLGHKPDKLNNAGQLGERVELPMHWIVGMIGNKDHADVFRALLRLGDYLYLVPVPAHLPVDLAQMQTLAESVCPHLAGCEVYPDVLPAITAAMSQKGTKVLCGSLYLIGDFLKRYGG